MTEETTEGADGDDLEIEVPENEDESAAKEPEIVIEEPEKAEKKPDKAAKPENDVDEALNQLREQMEAEKNRRIAAEKAANDAAQAVHKHKGEAHDANLHLISNAMRTVEQSNDILKSNLRMAYVAQDFEAVADIQAELASNAAKLTQLESGKQALETAPKEEAPQPYASDPVEQLASQLSQRSAAWVRAHPEFATDQRKFNAMLAAHNLAVSKGVEPDTDDYFDRIETLLDLKQSDGGRDATSAAAAPMQRRASPPAAAPVSRTSSTSGGNSNRVTLTAEEREMAGMMGMTDVEYARNKLALQREGRLN